MPGEGIGLGTVFHTERGWIAQFSIAGKRKGTPLRDCGGEDEAKARKAKIAVQTRPGARSAGSR